MCEVNFKSHSLQTTFICDVYYGIPIYECSLFEGNLFVCFVCLVEIYQTT
jgi:hypothetical protein